MIFQKVGLTRKMGLILPDTKSRRRQKKNIKVLGTEFFKIQNNQVRGNSLRFIMKMQNSLKHRKFRKCNKSNRKLLDELSKHYQPFTHSVLIFPMNLRPQKTKSPHSKVRSNFLKIRRNRPPVTPQQHIPHLHLQFLHTYHSA